MTIPTRPKGNKKYNLSLIEERCIAYYVMFEEDTTKAEAWRTFIMPTMSSDRELKPTKAFLNNHSALFFKRPDVVDFEKDYRDTIEMALSPTKQVYTMDKATKEAAVKERLLELVEEGVYKDKLTSSEVKDFTGIMDKIGLFDKEKIDVRPPERYLPVSCDGECLYKATIDKAIAEGKGENECERCKFKEFALGKGCKNYPPEKQLNK